LLLFVSFSSSYVVISYRFIFIARQVAIGILLLAGSCEAQAAGIKFTHRP